jgi:hypothetical protein
MSGGQHHQQSPNFYRSSFSPTDHHEAQYHSSNPHQQSHQAPPYHAAASNGHLNPLATAATAYTTSTSAATAPSRSQYYDPVDRTGKVRPSWGYPGRSPSPPIHSQPVREILTRRICFASSFQLLNVSCLLFAARGSMLDILFLTIDICGVL